MTTMKLEKSPSFRKEDIHFQTTHGLRKIKLKFETMSNGMKMKISHMKPCGEKMPTLKKAYIPSFSPYVSFSLPPLYSI